MEILVLIPFKQCITYDKLRAINITVGRVLQLFFNTRTYRPDGGFLLYSLDTKIIVMSLHHVT